MKTTKNVISNFFGQLYVASLGFIFLPFYLKSLGPEAFSLIGIYSLLQAWLHLLDGGLTATLGRESAKYLGGGHTHLSFRLLIRSIEYISIILSILMIIILAFGSNYVANNWLNPENLESNIIQKCLFIIALIIALRFIEGLYKSFLNGIQKQFLLNVINSINGTFRWVGAAILLKIGFNNPLSFFSWQLLSSLISTFTFGLASYKLLPKVPKKSLRFSSKSLFLIKEFAFGMIFINVLALVIGQTDKIILSRVLTLKSFGFYTLAASIAGFSFFLSSPITNAFYPLLCKYKQENDLELLIKTFHKSAKTISIFLGSTSIYFILFCKPILDIWISDTFIVSQITLLVQLLIFGNFLNTLMWIPYHTQLAYGWTSLTIKINLILCCIIVPSTYYVSITYGSIGVPFIWIFVNSIYLLFSINIMFQKILKTKKLKWLIDDTLKPLIYILVITLIFRFLYPINTSLFLKVLYIATTSITVLLSSLKVFKLKNLEII